MPVEEIPIHIAEKKALAVIQQLKDNKTFDIDQVVLAADTIVVLGNEVINKPADRTHAIDMLTRLSGNTHRVITGVVMMKDKIVQKFSVTTSVQFHPITQEQIEFYIDQYKPYDKAGSYAIQEWIGVVGIAGITGDFYNVMGLPVSKVVQALHTLNS
jgi:septum formation protein